MQIAVTTCVTLPEHDADSGPLIASLRARGIDAGALAWDDPDADFGGADITLLRSTWNYPWHVAAFLAWAEATAAQSVLLNGVEVVRWNHDKGYLLELQERGIPIAPTERVIRGDARSLAQILEERGFEDVVVKPAVSAGSYRTLRVRPTGLAAGEAHLRDLLEERDALVQAYLPSVETHGERSLIWIDGAFTHAVRKNPRFDGEAESVSEAVPIGAAERALGARVLDAVPFELAYARVDVAPGPDGSPVLMELELMEPSLYFRQGPAALDRLCDSLERRLSTL